MRKLTVVALFFLLLLSVACNRPPDTPQPPLPRDTAFGHMGKLKFGEFEGRVPFYQDGDLRVYVPQSGYPGKALGPAYVLITRLAPGVPVLSEGGLGGANDFLVISPAQLDSKGRKFRFEYKVGGDGPNGLWRPGGKPPVEELSAAGQSYQPDAGRVFLLDLTPDPPSLTQVAIDVTGVLARPDQDPTLEELKAGMEKLAGKDKAVRDFLNRIEKQ